MSFWPFGRDPAEIEIATRVITAATQNGYTLRGKLTIHFAEPQRQADADLAADRCALVASMLLREAQSHERVIGAEASVGAALLARYPEGVARPRLVEVAALHVVGDPALSDELRRASSGNPPAIHTPPTPPPGPLSQPPRSDFPPPISISAIAPPPSFSAPPISSGPLASGAPMSSRRRGSSQLRAIQSMLLPAGSSPAAMGAFIAPTVKDSAARLLIGFLRAHDLITLRGGAADASSAEALANLVPASDAPPGGYEASRVAEITRWQTILGLDVVAALRRETSAASAFLMLEAMRRAEVPEALAQAVIEAVCTNAFSNNVGLLEEIDRFPDALSLDLVVALAQRLSSIAETGDNPSTMTEALTPLVSVVYDDLSISAMVIKVSAG